MKFMKLGSKPDSFHNDGEKIRYVASELATDITIIVGDVKFYLHKFPLLSKSARLQKLVSSADHDNIDEIEISDVPGGPAIFEICAKFCYGMIATLNAYNVVAARCAAEYLEMYENVEKGNLVYKIEVFLSSSIFRSWKDSIIALQTTTALLPWAEELKVVSHCLDSIASKTSIDTSKVEWSYTYNRRKRPSESGNGNELHWNGVRKHKMVPSDWWVEDLCELPIDLYKQVITTIKTREKVSGLIIGEALNAYASRRLPGFYKGAIQANDLTKYRSLVGAVVELLPSGKSRVACSFLLRLLRAAISLDCGETEVLHLVKRISQQLEEATVADLLIRAPAGETIIDNVDIVKTIVEEFLKHVHRSAQIPGFDSENSKSVVAKLIDGYLAEIGCDPNLPAAKFIDLAEMVSSFSRLSHDGLYRAIDTYLKEHPGISKSERKKICRLMDCRKLSADACMHAMQNERLPLRVVVQILFFEQVRATSSSSGANTPDGRGSISTLLPGGSHGSSRSTATNTEDDWDGVPTLDDIKALKVQLSSLRMDGAKGNSNAEMMGASKMKGVAVSKRILSKIWSSRERNGEMSSSNTSESRSSSNAEETKSTPSRSRRHSLS